MEREDEHEKLVLGFVEHERRINILEGLLMELCGTMDKESE